LPQLTLISQAAAAARIAGKDDVIEAAKSGDIELVKDHVVAGAGCVLKANKRYVCFFRARAAAAHDVSNPVHRLCTLQLRSNFLISVISGNTALMRSSCYGRLEIARFLVESKADVAAKDNEYDTP
jgi:hypothetical protein